MILLVLFLVFWNPPGNFVGTGPNDDVYDSPIGMRCPGGKDHSGQASPEMNSPIETSAISVAPPFSMFLFFYLFSLPTCLYHCVCCKLHPCLCIENCIIHIYT